MKNIKSEANNLISVIEQSFEETFTECATPKERQEYDSVNNKLSIILNKIKEKLPEEFQYLVNECEETSTEKSAVTSDVYFRNGFRIGASLCYSTIPSIKEKKILEKTYNASIKKVI